MKILQICPYDYFGTGGVQNHIHHLSEKLREKGHQVKIIAPKFRIHQTDDLNLILIGKNSKIKFNKTQIDVNMLMPKDIKTVRKLLQQEHFDLLHFHTIWNPILPSQILSLSHTANIVTFHENPPNTILSSFLKTFIMPFSMLTITPKLDYVIAISETLVNYIQTIYEKKIDIIPNGIDLESFRVKQKPIAKYQDGKINLFFLGRLDKRKGVSYLVKAFHCLKPKYPQLRLIIAGEGLEFPKIKKYIEKHQIPDIEMIGFIEEKDKPQYYASGDIFCSPAIYGESQGIVLLEAMAMHKPIAGFANSGYQTVLNEKGGQQLVPPRDLKALTHLLEKFITNEKFRQEMAEWNYSEVQKYDWEIITNKILKAYEKAIINYQKRSR